MCHTHKVCSWKVGGLGSQDQLGVKVVEREQELKARGDKRR